MSRNYKHSYKETRKENTGLNVYNSGRQRCGPGYRWGPAVRDHYLLHYVAGGAGVYRCGEQGWTLHKGDLFLAYPDTVIMYQADEADPWEYRWVGFHGTDTKWLLERTAFSKEQPVLHAGPGEHAAAELLEAIYEARGMRASNDAAMTGRLYLLLSYLMERFPSQAVNTPGRDYFEQASRYIAGNLGGELSVQEIADYMGLSRSQLYRVFVAHSGMSPVEFLNHSRVNRAAGLLRESGLTVAQVSASVGYGDPLYFSRMFKRIKGIPPGRYRKRSGGTA